MKKNLLLLFLPLLAVGTSSAATIAIVGTPGLAGAATLPSAAGTDWGLWTTNANPVTPTASVTSTAGSRTFSVATVGGTGTPATRGSGSTGTTNFTFNNGDTVASGAGTQVGGIFNNAGVGTGTLNTGVSLDLTGFTTPVRIQLYTYTFEATGLLSVYLDGSSTASYTNSLTSTTSKAGHLYTFDYTPDGTGSSVRFAQTKTGSTDAISSNVGFLGISITPIPEASSVALVGTAAMIALLRRRRA